MRFSLVRALALLLAATMALQGFALGEGMAPLGVEPFAATELSTEAAEPVDSIEESSEESVEESPIPSDGAIVDAGEVEHAREAADMDILAAMMGKEVCSEQTRKGASENGGDDKPFPIMQFIGSSDGTQDLAAANAQEYEITVNQDDEHGAFMALSEKAAPGEAVELMSFPDEGYVHSLTILPESVTVEWDGDTGTFIMPDEPVVIFATFILQSWNISIQPPVHGAVRCDNETGVTSGALVKLTVEAAPGYALESLNVVGKSGVSVSLIEGTYSFNMPEEDVTVTASFLPQPQTITVLPSDHGSVTAVPGNGEARTGDSIALSGEANDGYEADGFTVTDAEGNGIVLENTENGCTFILPAGGATVAGSFRPVVYSIHFELLGGAFADGVTVPEMYTIESAGILLPEPSRVGYTFAGWYLNGVKWDSIPTGKFGNLDFTARWRENLPEGLHIEPQTYTGQPLTPQVYLAGGEALNPVSDYELVAGEMKDADDYRVTISGRGDYAGSAALTFTILPKPVTITGLSIKDRIYDGTTVAEIVGTPAIEGNVDGAGLRVVDGSAEFLSRNAGKQTATFSGFALAGDAAKNYKLAAQPRSATATISPKPVTITGLTVEDKTYDGTTKAVVTGKPVIVGAVDGDDVSVFDGSASFDSRDAGERTATFSGFALAGDAAKNYKLAAQPGSATATISPKPVTITGLTVEDKTYDGTTEASISGTPVIMGVVENDHLEVVPGRAQFKSKDAGTRTACFTGFGLKGTAAKNYALNDQPGDVTATISPMPVRPYVYATPRVYRPGDVTVALVCAELEWPANDDVRVVAPEHGTMADDAAGANKPVTLPELTLSGPDAGNYTVVQPSGVSVRIDKAAWTNCSAQGAAKYGNPGSVCLSSQLAEGGTPGAPTVTSDEGILKEAPAIEGDGLAFTLRGDPACAGKAAVVSVPVSGAKNYEDYAIAVRISALDKGAQSLSFAQDNWILTYGGESFPLTAEHLAGDGAIRYESDRPDVLSIDPNTGMAKIHAVGEATVTARAAETADFAPADASCAIIVNPRPVTIRGLSAKDKVYDGGDGAKILGTATLENTLPDDELTLVPGAARFADKAAGQNKAVAFSGFRLEGAAKDNYVLAAQPASVQAGIAPRPVTVRLSATGRVYEEGNVAVALTGTAEGLLAGDDVRAVLPRTGTLADDGAGTGKPVTPDAEPALTGADAGNYALVDETGALTVDIARDSWYYRRAAGSARCGVAGTVELSEKIAPQGVAGAPVAEDASLFAEAPSVSQGTLRFTFAEDIAAVGEETATTVTVPVTGAPNYEDYAITVTLTAQGRQGRGLSFAHALVSCAYGDACEGQTAVLTPDGAAEIAYASSDESVARVDVATGAVTILSAGEAVITARAAATPDFAAAEGRYSLFVTPRRVDAPTVVVAQSVVTYDGKEKRPGVTVLDGGAVIPASEYALRYSDNVEVGTALVTVVDNPGGNYIVNGGARFEIRRAVYRVSYVVDGSVLETRSTTAQGTAPRPADPEKEGYVFEGWYTDSAMTRAFDFSTVLNGSLTLYARLTPVRIDLKVSIADWTEGETPSEPVATGVPKGAKAAFAYKPRGAGDAAYVPERPEAAGEYTLRASVTLGDVTTEATVDFVIRAKKPDPVAVSPEVRAAFDAATGRLILTLTDGSEALTDADYVVRYETDATRGATFAVVSPAEDGAYTFPPMRFQLPADLGGLSFATARVADGQLRVSWTAVQGAAGYDLFFGPAGGAMARVEAGSATAWTLPAPESEDVCEVIVRGYVLVGGTRVYVSQSLSAVVCTCADGKKAGNPTRLRLAKRKVTLNRRKTFRIRAAVTGGKMKALRKYARLRYISSDPAIATVSARGRVKAVARGRCTIYVLTVNGLRKKLRVTVK